MSSGADERYSGLKIAHGDRMLFEHLRIARNHRVAN